ncbi:Hypothetical_protein [Hexamita inflata]|uniref:Hypothetical_protein n=1 Tax=Hexamita inflata TaxID=28002 RepID=A0AA86U953_9EUKA|nr:Hypothetical protein HINF_LOCUS31261 [Hexamita inflata]
MQVFHIQTYKIFVYTKNITYQLQADQVFVAQMTKISNIQDQIYYFKLFKYQTAGNAVGEISLREFFILFNSFRLYDVPFLRKSGDVRYKSVDEQRSKNSECTLALLQYLQQRANTTMIVGPYQVRYISVFMK